MLVSFPFQEGCGPASMPVACHHMGEASVWHKWTLWHTDVADQQFVTVPFLLDVVILHIPVYQSCRMGAWCVFPEWETPGRVSVVSPVNNHMYLDLT